MKPTYVQLDDNTIMCVLRDKANNIVKGYATCHPEEPHYSQRVGEYIATIRAEIEYYKFIRRYEIRPQLKALKHTYSCLTTTGSKEYRADSPETRLVRRHYWLMKEDYDNLGEIIKELEAVLANYLATRDSLVGQKKEN